MVDTFYFFYYLSITLIIASGVFSVAKFFSFRKNSKSKLN